MGEEFETTQVSCRVETKIWTRPLNDGQRAYSFVADLSFLLPTRVFWVIRFAAPVVLCSFLSFRP